jgi:hypothetical protein
MTAALAFLLKNWRILALGGLIALLGLQTARLHNAKADQFDRTACVAKQPCRPPKWKGEAISLRQALSVSQDGLSTCRANSDALTASMTSQNAAVAAQKAASDARVAQATKAAQQARSVAESARQASNTILGKHLAGVNACDRAAEVDAAFLEALK